MVRLLIALIALVSAAPGAAELSDRHQIAIGLNLSLIDADSDLAPWTEGGSGKLRYPAGGTEATRLFIEYRGQLGTGLFAHAVADYLDDAGTAGLTEAYLEWRPLPSGPNRHRFRFGAFYPVMSVENTAHAWESPYSRNYSAINAWIGEEIRAIGGDWRLSRRIGSSGSPHELGASASVFYGNDTAATLLFWRGWSVHDRQTRLNESLPLPGLRFANPGGPDVEIARSVDPIAEIDHEPGIAVTGEWRYARTAGLTLGYWDNRADPLRFRDGQWAWDTRFWHFGAQFELPGGVGLIAQRMRGNTAWLVNVTATGQTTPQTTLETDEFDARFMLLSRTFGERHRLSVRRDDFDLWRPGVLQVDKGQATTLSYAYAVSRQLTLRAEWLEIDSTRDLWPVFYAQPRERRTESVAQLAFEWILFDNTG